MFVKFCGFTRVQDITAAAALGISAAGLVFDPRSPRAVSAGHARELIAAIAGSGVITVGVFVDATVQQIVETCERARIDRVQVYDDETCRSLRGFRPLIRAYRMHGGGAGRVPAPGKDELILLDSFSPHAHGGTGTRFDWETLKSFPFLHKTIVAGGISAGSLPRLLTAAVPFGIDVSSGIEDTPGVKSHTRMASLITKVQEASHAHAHHA